MAEAYGLTSCTFGIVPESKLSHKSEVHDGFVPKHSHHGGENNKKRFSLRSCFLATAGFLPHERFDVRQDMDSYWQGDGVSLLTDRCLTITGQRHRVPNLSGGVFPVFVNITYETTNDNI